MKKSILEIYALVVCFFTLACFVITLGTAIYDIVQITRPDFTLKKYDYEKYQTNEKFLQFWPKDKTIPSDKKVSELRKENFEITLRAESRSGMQDLINAVIIILINSVMFVFHWRLAKKERGYSVHT